MSLKKWKSNSYYCTTFLSVWKCVRFSSRRKKNAPKASKAAHLGSLEAIWGTSVVEAWGKCSICQDFQNETIQAMLSQEGGEGEKSPPIQSVAIWCKSMLEITTLCLWRCFHLDKWILHQNRDYLEKDPTLAMEATPRVATNCSIPEFSRLQSCPVEILKGIHPDTKCGEYGVIKKHLGHDKRTGEGSMATEDSQGSRSRSWQKVN